MFVLSCHLWEIHDILISRGKCAFLVFLLLWDFKICQFWNFTCVKRHWYWELWLLLKWLSMPWSPTRDNCVPTCYSSVSDKQLRVTKTVLVSKSINRMQKFHFDIFSWLRVCANRWIIHFWYMLFASHLS